MKRYFYAIILGILLTFPATTQAFQPGGGGGAGSGDAISEGDTKVETIDLGTGEIVFTVDDEELQMTVADNILDIASDTGITLIDFDLAIKADSIETDASSTPGIVAADSDAPGEDQEVGKFYWNYTEGAAGEEYADAWLQVMRDGSEYTIFHIDNSPAGVEIDFGANSIVVGAPVQGNVHIFNKSAEDSPFVMAGDDASNTAVFWSGSGETDLPSIDYGQIVNIGVTTAAQIWIDPDGSESISHDGDVLPAGHRLTNGDTPGDDDNITLISNGTYWYTRGGKGTWVDADE